MAFAQCLSLASICLPPLARRIGAFAFPHSKIRVDSDNLFLRACDDFLLSVEESSILQYFGADEHVAIGAILTRFDPDLRISRIAKASFCAKSTLHSICIPSSIEFLSPHCFRACDNLETVVFEAGCRISVIAPCAFGNCSSLKSVCIPASVEVLGKSCFRDCSSLSNVTFEPGCKVSAFGRTVFRGCSSLESICIPASVEEIDDLLFFDCGTDPTVTFEPGSRYLLTHENPFCRV
jgi:hypothetical protein